MNGVTPVGASLLRTEFAAYVAYAFKKEHGTTLGDQKYVALMCYVISSLINGKIRRLLINLPPQHLKSFVGTICLAAFLLGTNPRLRILLVAYSDDFAEALCSRIRDMMRCDWYRAIFKTQIRDDHARAHDFRTTDGGGIFAVAATGQVTGRTGDIVLYDDPHQLQDWANERKLNIVRANFNIILSRLHDKANGRVIVVAHRVAENDLSADLLNEPRWSVLRLPMIATRRRAYDLGYETWVRERGDVLQQRAYPKAEIERLRRTQSDPPFDLFYQQGLDRSSSLKPRPEDFQAFNLRERPIVPVVLSIDPGQSGGVNASRSVIQAWTSFTGRHYLVDQFCEQTDFEDLRKQFWRFVRRYRPSVALIEKTANGPALYSAVRRKAKFKLDLIVPRDPKASRLNQHIAKIRAKKIFLPDDSIWREAFIAEVVGFPGIFDDQVDAFTQYLDFMDTNPVIPAPRPRENGGAIAFYPSLLRPR